MSTSTISGELNFSTKITESLAELYLNPNRSDVVFVVDGEKLPAHKFILSLRSSYFHALTCGSFPESSEREIVLKVPLNAFKHVLRYIYTGCVSLHGMDHETVLELLSLSDEYSMEEVKLAIISHLTENVSLNNCCGAFDAACLYQSEELKGAALNFLGQNVSAALESGDFKKMAIAALRELLQCNTLFVPEIDLFKAVLKWRQHNPDVPDNELQTLISNIRFELMEWEHLISTVRESSILSEKRLLDLMSVKISTKNLNYRSDCKPGINVATIEFNASVIKGSDELQLLNGDVSSYGDANGYTHHEICGPATDFIVVKLDHIFMLNQMEMLLWDRDNRSYSYYIEVSTNQEQWRRVVDHTKNCCRSWQFLHFEAQPFRYIKIVGTKNTVNCRFHVVHLAAYYKNDQPTLINGFVSPTLNVASKENGAKVIKGKCRGSDTLDVLLNGDAINYTGDSGFVEHDMIGSESIVIQLTQPFQIGSVRLLLWDGDDRTYSFYIETSTNQTDWKMAVDKRGERLKSWQEFSFDCRPVVFFKITGTFNADPSYNGFHLVHFEAPNMNEMNYANNPKQERQKLSGP